MSEASRYDTALRKRPGNKYKAQPYTMWRILIPYAPHDKYGAEKERYVLMLDCGYEDLPSLDDDPDAPMEASPYFVWFTHSAEAYEKCCNLYKYGDLSKSEKAESGLGNVFVPESMVQEFKVMSPSSMDFIRSFRSFDSHGDEGISAAWFELNGQYLGRLSKRAIKWLYGFKDEIKAVVNYGLLPLNEVEETWRSNDDWLRRRNNEALERGRGWRLMESGELDKKASSSDVIDFIEDLYDLRKESISDEGEYGIGNLVFKEFRNRGWLDNLKEMRDELRSRELSLEGLNEAVGTMTDPELLGYVMECVKFLASKGYDAKMDDLAVYWDERTRRFGALGWPEYEGGPFRLYLSKHLKGEPEEVVKSTIYHELCHYLTDKKAFSDGAVYWSSQGRLKANVADFGRSYKKYLHHNEVWKKMAADVGALTGHNITRTDTYTNHTEVGKAYDAKVKYVAKCKHCGREFTATRLTPFMKSAIQGNNAGWYCKCPDGYKGKDFDMLMIDGKKTEAGEPNANG